MPKCPCGLGGWRGIMGRGGPLNWVRGWDRETRWDGWLAENYLHGGDEGVEGSVWFRAPLGDGVAGAEILIPGVVRRGVVRLMGGGFAILDGGGTRTAAELEAKMQEHWRSCDWPKSRAKDFRGAMRIARKSFRYGKHLVSECSHARRPKHTGSE